jgi:uncharacterized membrane protein (TIGR02234 family)
VRGRTAAYLALLLGGGLALVASSQAWWRAVGTGVSVRFTGSQASGGLSQALGLVALAGTLLILALRARGRQVVAGLLVVVAAGAVLVGILRLRPSADAVRTQVREVSLADQFQVLATVWPTVYAAAGVLVALGAGLVLGTARRWPVRADRFARAAEPSVTAPSGDPGDVWRAMDAGLDPTVDRPADDPDVRKTEVADTMEQSDGSVRTGLSAPASPPEETEVRNG